MAWASSFYRNSRYRDKFEKLVTDNAVRNSNEASQEQENKVNDHLVATYQRMKEQELIDV